MTIVGTVLKALTGFDGSKVKKRTWKEDEVNLKSMKSIESMKSMICGSKVSTSREKSVAFATDKHRRQIHETS